MGWVSSIILVLKLECASESPRGLKHRLLGPTPRVPYSIHLNLHVLHVPGGADSVGLTIAFR